MLNKIHFNYIPIQLEGSASCLISDSQTQFEPLLLKDVEKCNSFPAIKELIFSVLNTTDIEYFPFIPLSELLYNSCIYLVLAYILETNGYI